MENSKNESGKKLITPDHPHQCIKCEINFHNRGYKFIINPRHHCWFEEKTFLVEQLTICPECSTELEKDLDTDDDYCPKCGLITRSYSEYTAGQKVDLPYGKL